MNMLCANCGCGQSMDCAAQAWIHACVDNSWIACSICRSFKVKGTEHGFGQSSDTDICHMAGCLSKQEFQA